MLSFATKAIKYFTNLNSTIKLLGRVKILNPYEKNEVNSAVSQFFQKFYYDERKRIFILGINPGRFGGGLTGISFTDPVALRKHCGIDNQLGSKEELSSKFIYEVINHFGGVKNFFSHFFLSAIYPLALIKDGKNHNYYDSQKLFDTLRPHLLKSLEEQILFGAERTVVVCLGKKNAEYLKMLDNEIHLFDKIEILDHPRFIMQYRKKKMEDYIKKYLAILNSSLL